MISRYLGASHARRGDGVVSHVEHLIVRDGSGVAKVVHSSQLSLRHLEGSLLCNVMGWGNDTALSDREHVREDGHRVRDIDDAVVSHDLSDEVARLGTRVNT